MKKKVVVILGSIIIIAIASIIYIFNAPRKDFSNSNVDYSVSINTLIAEFEKDEDLASKKYVNKILLVNGTIDEIVSNNGKGSTCRISSDNAMIGIICEFEPGTDEELRTHLPGDSITIVGKCSGYLMDVLLNACSIDKK